ncbi:hypothetical protein I3760_13G113300 [Carya illinoinensis]|nr:hypothetical protein I3760_13G113300 [Carya illinoinensis]
MEGKTASRAAILEVLDHDKDNYVDWSIRVKTYLLGQDLWDIVEATIEQPKQEDGAAFKLWSKKNHMALHVIQNSCGTDTFYEIRKIVSAKIAWDTLAEMYNVPKDTNSVVSEVLGKDNYEDWSARVKSYLKAYDLWDAVEVIIEPPKQEDDQTHDAFKAWNKKNYMALNVIQNSCGLHSFSQIREITSAKIAWDTLAGVHNVPKNTNSVVREVLKKDNYKDWSARLKTYLMAHDLWDIIEQTTEPKKQEDDGIALEAWNKKNLIALDAIKNSCGPNTFSGLGINITSAKIAWDALAEKYSGTDNVSVDADDGYRMYGDLCKAVRSGNWTAAKEFLERSPNAVGARITQEGHTALHIAVAAGHFLVVDELVKLMPEQNLETLDYDGFSALSEAAVGGKKAMAQCMLSKNEKLISIPTSDGFLPVCTAIYYGHIETARYLYSLTPREDLMPERSYNGANLFISAISAGTLDIALDLLQRCPSLIFANNVYGKHPLLALASTPHLFPSGSRLVFWKRWIYKYC